MKHTPSQKGFSLIELLIVVAVIISAHLGIISTAAVAAPILIYAFNLAIGVIQAAVFTLLTIA